MSNNVLKVENVTMQFGGVVAVNNLNLEINEGEIVALIGPNGAGKTTAFNVVTGVYQPTNGAVWFNGEKIIENYPQGKMKKMYKGQHEGEYTQKLAPTPDKVTKLGMARTFQNIRLWKSQTVFDNVLIAKHCRSTSNVFSATFRPDSVRVMKPSASTTMGQDAWRIREVTRRSCPTACDNPQPQTMALARPAATINA